MQLKVIKSDGSIEEYLHTKVMGTFNRALALAGRLNIYAAEQCAEAVTFYLYQKGTGIVTTDEIYSNVRVVLSSAGHEDADEALHEYQLNRKLRRRRVEVIEDGENGSTGDEQSLCQWDKSKITRDLMKKNSLDQYVARTIASSVEEKILNIGMARVRRNLIKQLVLAETDTMLQAHVHLQTACI